MKLQEMLSEKYRSDLRKFSRESYFEENVEIYILLEDPDISIVTLNHMIKDKDINCSMKSITKDTRAQLKKEIEENLSSQIGPFEEYLKKKNTHCKLPITPPTSPRSTSQRGGAIHKKITKIIKRINKIIRE
jgi:hypothetical protein